MITLPIRLIMRIADLLGDIVKMKPGFEIYETANVLVKDLTDEIQRDLKIREII